MTTLPAKTKTEEIKHRTDFERMMMAAKEVERRKRDEEQERKRRRQDEQREAKRKNRSKDDYILVDALSTSAPLHFALLACQ